jgi:hypothetical protein
MNVKMTQRFIKIYISPDIKNTNSLGPEIMVENLCSRCNTLSGFAIDLKPRFSEHESRSALILEAKFNKLFMSNSFLKTFAVKFSSKIDEKMTRDILVDPRPGPL